jgi:hypothetical protein
MEARVVGLLAFFQFWPVTRQSLKAISEYPGKCEAICETVFAPK